MMADEPVERQQKMVAKSDAPANFLQQLTEYTSSFFIKKPLGNKLSPITNICARQPLIFLASTFVALALTMPIIDGLANKSVDSVVETNSVIYLTAKSLNAALSVAKSSQASVGVGIVHGSVTVGAALDPLDQFIDDFSDWLLEATAALIVIHIFIQFFTSINLFGFALIISPIILLIICHKYGRKSGSSIYRSAKSILVILLFLRLCFLLG